MSEESKQATEAVETVPDEGAVEVTPDEGAAKTYTQSEVDHLIGLQKAKLPDKETFEKFTEWQKEQQKAEDSKLSDEAKTRVAAAEAEAKRLKAQVAALKLNVAADAVDDVVALAERLVTDEVTIDAAIESVLKKYPQFAVVQKPADEAEVKPPQFLKPNNNKPLAKGTNQEMNDLIRQKRRR